MEKFEITQQLKALIEEQDEITIKDADQRLDIDSYTMMLIITYVGEELDVQLDMDTLDFDSFLSLNTFAELVLEQGARTAAE